MGLENAREASPNAWMAAGGRFSIFLRGDGEAVGCGLNNRGQPGRCSVHERGGQGKLTGRLCMTIFWSLFFQMKA